MGDTESLDRCGEDCHEAKKQINKGLFSSSFLDIPQQNLEGSQ